MRKVEITVEDEIVRVDGHVAGVVGDGNSTPMHVVFSDSWSGYAKKAIFADALQTAAVSVLLTNDLLTNAVASVNDYTFNIPPEALIYAGKCSVLFYGCKGSQATPSAEMFSEKVLLDVLQGRSGVLNPNAGNSTEPTPSEVSQLQQAIEALLPYLLRETDGSLSFEDNTLSVVTAASAEERNGLPISSAAVYDAIGNIEKGDKGDKGDQGERGNGIASVEKTGTSGVVDTYTITFDNGDTTTYTVTNGADGADGKSISSIEKTSSSGRADTYTITMTDGTTLTFTVTNGEKGDQGIRGEKGDKGDKGDRGNGIVSVYKSGNIDNITDVYNILFDNGAETSFYVTNGERGQQGEKGEKGDKGDKGDKGNTGDVHFSSFEVDPETGVLWQDYAGDGDEITFLLADDKYLEVEIT